MGKKKTKKKKNINNNNKKNNREINQNNVVSKFSHHIMYLIYKCFCYVEALPPFIVGF